MIGDVKMQIRQILIKSKAAAEQKTRQEPPCFDSFDKTYELNKVKDVSMSDDEYSEIADPPKDSQKKE